MLVVESARWKRDVRAGAEVRFMACLRRQYREMWVRHGGEMQTGSVAESVLEERPLPSRILSGRLCVWSYLVSCSLHIITREASRCQRTQSLSVEGVVTGEHSAVEPTTNQSKSVKSGLSGRAVAGQQNTLHHDCGQS
jgi:hypothetical protein